MDITKEGHLSVEHVIPRALGGILTCNCLCQPCNDIVGQHESALKEDPSIRLALENLRHKAPWLCDRISSGQTFTGESKSAQWKQRTGEASTE